MNNETQEILNGLNPMFEKADKEKLWFHSFYQDLWYSPQELREKHKEGRFLWGSVNWELRDPNDKLNNMRCSLINIEKSIKDLEVRINK